MSFFETTLAENYIPWEYQEQVFLKTNKCKVSIQILSTKSITDPNDILWCYGNFYITGNLWNSELQIYWLNKIWECVWSETIFPLYKYGKEASISYYPKIWDTIYAIINSDSKEILKFGKTEYEKYSEIPICKWESLSDYYYPIFWWWFLVSLILACIFFLKKKKVIK